MTFGLIKNIYYLLYFNRNINPHGPIQSNRTRNFATETSMNVTENVLKKLYILQIL